MKIIPKFQRGGGLESLFTVYTPPQRKQATSQQPTKSKKDDSEGKLTERDFFTMMKDIDGLPNEMLALVINTKNTFGAVGSENLATQYLDNLYKLRLAQNNKKQFDEAHKASITSGSFSEPAITADGKLMVQKKDGSIDKVSLETFAKNKDKYASILSVSNLLNLRAYSSSFINDFSTFDTVNSSFGYQKFQNLIKEAVVTLGQSTNSKEGIFGVEGQAVKGLDAIRKLSLSDQAQIAGSITTEGLYKYKVIDKDQKNQINALTQYISTLLPENAKVWAALKLNTTNKESAVNSLILSYLLSKSSPSHEFEIDYKGTPKDKQDKSDKESSSSTNSPNMTFLTAIQNGYGGSYERRKYNPGGNGAFNVTGTYYGAFLNSDGDVISNATLQDVLTKTGLSGITNTSSITFGDNLIRPNQLPFIAVQNTGVVRAILPCKRNGSQVVPDFELLDKYDTLVQEVNKELGSTATFEQRENALQRKISQTPELQELLDVSGKLDYNKFCAFAIVDGLASEINFTFKSRNGQNISDQSNPLISEVNDDVDEQYFQSVTELKLNDGLLQDIFGLNKEKLYKSAIFIPINTNNRLSGVLFSGQKPKDDTALKLEQEYQNSLRTQNLNSSNPLLLWQ